MPSAKIVSMRLICCISLLAHVLLATAQEAPQPPLPGDPSATPTESAAAPDSAENAGDVADAGVDAVPAATRFELEIEIGDLVESEDLAAAAARLDDLLALTEAEFGAASAELADTYVRTAEIRGRAGNYDAAVQDALRAIEIYRTAIGPFAIEMVAPYVVLGDSYGASGDFLSALSAYSEARTVSRRVDGLLNMGQIEIIDRMTVAAKSLNRMDEAQTLQLEALNLVERGHDPLSPEAIDAAFKYALWLRQNNLFTRELEQYERIDRIVRKEHGDDSVLLVRGLRERANSFRVQGVASSLGISGLRDALEILEASPDALMMAELLRDLGDWEVAFSRVGTTGESYLRSWELLGQIESGEELRREWYERTHIVNLAILSQRGLSSEPGAPQGHVVVQFTVDTAGRTRDVVVVESDPPGFKDEAVLRQFRASRFRPMISDGALVAARRAFNIQFNYAAPGD